MSKGTFKKKLWDNQFSDITTLLKKSLQSTEKYAKKMFDNQQRFYEQQSISFISSLKKTTTVTLTLSSQKIYNQLATKLKALTELFFTNDSQKEDYDQLKIRSSRIERLLRLLQKSEEGVQVKMNTENIRNLMQYQSKLNMKEDLFIFKCYISEEEDPKRAMLIKRQSFPKQTQLTMKVIHGYFTQEVTSIICANLPTFGSYKPIFNKAMQSKEIKQFKEGDSRGQTKVLLGEDNQSNSKTCFTYFGHAMQFDFFNSLLQPISLENYIRRFSIIEDAAICRGLILGAFDSLPDADPELDDSDQQQKWEEEVQKMAKDFCGFFEGYFDDEQQSNDVMEIAGKLANIKRQTKENISVLLRKYWCK